MQPEGATRPGELPLERFRSYLGFLARMHYDSRLRGKADVSDIVQETMIKAHERRGQWRGSNSAEFAGWLRQILVHTMADALRGIQRQKRDVALEKSLESAVGSSSCRLADLVAQTQRTPSQMVAVQEQILLMTSALEKLPPAQQDALLFKYVQGMTLEETARQMDRTPASVASLLRRGLAELRSATEFGADRHVRTPT